MSSALAETLDKHDVSSEKSGELSKSSRTASANAELSGRNPFVSIQLEKDLGEVVVFLRVSSLASEPALGVFKSTLVAASCYGNVILDFSNLREISPYAVATVLKVHRILSARGGEIRIRNARPAVKDRLQTMEIDRVVTIE